MTARRSARGGRHGSGQASPGGSGTAAIACGRLANLRSTGSIWLACFSTSSRSGHRPAGFPWFEAPEPGRVDAARVLLERLGASRARPSLRWATSCGASPCTLGSGRVLMAADGAWEAAAACAWLSEGRGTGPGHAATSCDLLPLDRSVVERAAPHPASGRHALSNGAGTAWKRRSAARGRARAAASAARRLSRPGRHDGARAIARGSSCRRDGAR